MRKSVFLLAAIALFVGAAFCFPRGTSVVEAGSSKTYIVSSSTIDATSINAGDVFITGKVGAADGKVLFNTESAKEKITTKTKAFNMKEYGVTTLFDFTSTFSFSSFAEGGEFAMVFGLNELRGDVGAADSFAIKVTYSSSDKSFTIGVSEYLEDGREAVIFAPQVAGVMQLNRETTFKVFVDTDEKLTITMETAGRKSVIVQGRKLSVNPEGFISYVSNGRNEITLSDPLILAYEYDAPETIDYLETFDNGYNSNVFYTESTASPFTPSSLSVENGSLVFKNTAAAHITTRYTYSNFELSFDITDMARKAELDENGNIVSLVNSWFGIAFGVNSVNEVPDTTARYSTWLMVGGVHDTVDDFVNPILGNRHYLLWDNNGSWNNVTEQQYMTDFNPWDERYDGETINVKLSMTDGLVEYFMKTDGDPDYGEPYFSYDFGRVKTGYIRIFTAGETSIRDIGLKYNNVGNFTIDNLSIRDTDHENVKKLLPTPEYKSNLWQKTPDYDYKTKPDDNDLLGNKIKNGNVSGNNGSGCSSYAGCGFTLTPLAAFIACLRKKK